MFVSLGSGQESSYATTESLQNFYEFMKKNLSFFKNMQKVKVPFLIKNTKKNELKLFKLKRSASITKVNIIKVPERKLKKIFSAISK